MLSSPLVDLAHRALTDARRTLLVEGTKRLTFAEVHRQALAIGAYLRSLGIVKGDRVAVLMGKSHKQAIAQLGALASEAIMVPVSELLKPDQVRHILRDCSVKALIADHDRIDAAGDLVSTLRIISVGGSSPRAIGTLEAIVDSPASPWRPQLIGQDSAAIIYSSGSTGLPKGIVLSHRNLWDGARIVTSADYLGLGPDDRLAQVMSLNFDYGLNQLYGAIRVGAELHFTTFHFPKDLFVFLRASGITTLALMPVFLNRLFDPRFFKPEFAEGIATLKRITTSGGRMPLPTVRAIRSAFPKTDLYLMYGLTEAFRSTFLPPSEVDRRPGSIGKAIPDAQMLVLDEHGQECAPGVPGELVHRGGVISKGYWNAPEKSAERFKMLADPSGNAETVVYSGDLVHRDEDGYLYFMGRRDNMIKTSGHRVSPEEIERAAEQMGDVEHAVAFGREHDVLGEEIILVAIARGGHTVEEAAVKSFLRERLAAYMIPSRVLVQQGFAVTPGNQGKVDRTLAKTRALEMLTKS